MRKLLAVLTALVLLPCCGASGLALSAAQEEQTPTLAPASGGDAGAEEVATNPNGADANNANASLVLTHSPAYLAASLDATKCVGLVGTAQGNVGLWHCTDAGPVSFTYTADQMLQSNSEKVCLVSTSTTYLGNALVDKAPCNSTANNQKWLPFAEGWKNADTNTCLSTVPTRVGYNAPLLLRSCDASAEQVWRPLTALGTAPFDPLASATTIIGRCTPVIEMDATTQVSNANASVFTKLYPNLVANLRQTMADDCNLLFATAQNVTANRSYLRIVLQDDPNVVASLSDNELNIGVNFFIWQYKTNGLPLDLMGALHHEITHFYQFNPQDIATPSYWIEGMAEYVRIATGYAPLTDRYKGAPYTTSYRPTGFFLLYLDQTYPGFMRRMEQAISRQTTPWDNAWFKTQTGKTVDQLWTAYQASF